MFGKRKKMGGPYINIIKYLTTKINKLFSNKLLLILLLFFY